MSWVRRFHRLFNTFARACVRVLLVFAVLVFVADASNRIVTQVLPTGWFFALDRVAILPGGRLAIIYRSSRFGDLPVSVITELIGPGNRQPCAASGRRLIEADTSEAIVPIMRLLPACDFREIPDGVYYIHLTVSFPAGGAYDKSDTVRSDNGLVVEGGRVVGSSVPGQE